MTALMSTPVFAWLHLRRNLKIAVDGDTLIQISPAGWLAEDYQEWVD